MYKQEFYMTPAWTSGRDKMVVHWDDHNVQQELVDLLERRKPERPAKLGSIIDEQQGVVMLGYFFDLLKFAPTTHPLTTELVVACFQLAGSVVMYFKNKFNRVRPWVLESRLSPPIPYPGHPAYPSGHSTQMHLMAMTAAYLVPSAEAALMERAWDVAVNRERAGLHYRSDTEAGRALAHQVFAILTSDCAMFKRTLKKAKDTEWVEALRLVG
ncbi:MAG: hypothetical protein DMD91_12810 [Candidatus Rokuibacteriota bacterium]|nr:MAG: hypothetical protein DMD91_12810 [Candidatus Rokubacteria bacterium]